ncbi:MAG: dihydroorotate dehydrogenase B catalytic subunit [Deltaproteobacteria bacterium RBG_16_64_85]|nr:MAG: dihydroorotate dehydrogenase B catalytic subunit [Deltaproteobacteria bacterium RBG_16_64_85]
MKPDLSVSLGRLRLKNPVMSASGTFGYGLEFSPFYDISRLGAVVVKGLSLAPTPGNPPGRIVETASGMLNAIGLQNIGVERFIEEVAPRLSDAGATFAANIYGRTVEEYESVAVRLSELSSLAAIEVNASCPNVKEGGMAFGATPEGISHLTGRVRKATGKSLWVKLSPNVADIASVAAAAEGAGADAVSLINTIVGMAVDHRTRRPKLSNVTGGLSGPAIKPVALRMVWEVCRRVKIPVIGIGGIQTAADALEFLLVGASAVQVGTANFRNPRACVEILEGVETFLREERLAGISEYRGKLHL